VFANNESTPPKRSVAAACHQVIASTLLYQRNCQRPAAGPGVDRGRGPLNSVLVARGDRHVRPSAASARATAKPSLLLAPPTIATYS
jgi:hypothetical protein